MTSDLAEDASGRQLFEMAVGLINRYNAINRQPRDYGTGVPLSVAELHLVEAIGKNETTTATQAAHRMGVTKGAVSQMLPRLERKGIVTRAPSPMDGRVTDITLTDLGRAAFERHAAVHERLLSVFEQAADEMSPCSRADAAMLMRSICGFLDDLQDEGKVVS